MAVIPIEQTNSPAEYPLHATKRFHNSSIRFLDGTEQRFRARHQPSMIWQLQYRNQNPGEMAAWMPFLDGALGSQSVFDFIDPVGMTVHSGSRMAANDVEVEQVGVHRADIAIAIRNEGS
ncbi:MAG: hypothetical protein JNK48_35055 [Bryobacterales bacterium]|nr:hypothetical protein [Bryobacterales bacterium]